MRLRPRLKRVILFETGLPHRNSSIQSFCSSFLLAKNQLDLEWLLSRTLAEEERLRLVASEQFHESLIGQYRDLIHEAVLESESDHKTRVNIGKLNAKLQVILKAAAYDGLPENVVNELIDNAIPATKAA